MSTSDPHSRNATAGVKPGQDHNAADSVSEQVNECRADQGAPVLNTDRLSPAEMSDLAWSRVQAFRQSGRLKDIEEAVEYATRALELTPDGHPDLPRRLVRTGVSYDVRARRLGQVEDRNKSIEYLSHAVSLTPDDHPLCGARQFDLGISLGERFKRLGQLEDLEQAIEHKSRALELTPDSHPRISGRHESLGTSYAERFRRLGRMQDLEQEIEHFSRALTLTPDGHPDLSSRHANLGASHTERFQRLGETRDLEQAIEHNSRAVELIPDGHPQFSSRHANLGVSYTDRFRRLGDIRDLEQAIEHHSRALGSAPDGYQELSRLHANLGASYTDRFKHLGEIRDLEQAIEHSSCALALTPDGHPNLSERHASLGGSYSDRFRRLGDIRDLELAMEHDSRALALTPDGHPDLSARHANLGVCYSDRFNRLAEIRDLEQAIEHYSSALALTPDDHPDMSTRHAHLGGSYDDRFRSLGEISDLDKAIEYQSLALASTPQGHPEFPRRNFNQAQCYFRQYQRTRAQTSLQHSLHYFRNASQGLSGAPRLKFDYASRWAKIASSHPGLECIEAYQTTIDLLPQFIWLGAATKTRYDDLSKAENLAINAAFAAVRHSSYPLAIEWLEHARCVVWNQSLMLRSPLDQLHACHPELASRLRTVSNKLYDLGDESGSSQPNSSVSMSQEEAGRQRRSLALDYRDLLAEARALPGFEDFLRPMGASLLQRAATFGPIVVINCHADQCDALVIMPGQGDIKHLSLPNFTAEKARTAHLQLQTSLRRSGFRQRGCRVRQEPGYQDKVSGMLRELWNNLIKPILDFLGLMSDVPTDSLPHITWCPTGALSFLPLHAAGDYDQPRSRVFDYAISSYIPTLSTLLLSTPSTLSQSSRLLAIGQAYTPGQTPLPGTATELECLKGHVQNQAGYTLLMDDRATTSAVLDAMEEHDWVHLACHAHQNVEDSTKSGFFLHDGTLDLASINRRSFRNKGLAFLSACQTATGDEKLPDEAIHLASGMLMARYSSVIATMWSVVDKDAPFVADKVYAALLKDGKLGRGEAGKALHYAVAALREQVGEKKFGRWVPYIHVGA